jgi:prophage antirepressor-like protein
MTDLINNIDITLSFNKDSIRVIGTHDNPYFVVNDICKILGIKNVSQAMGTIPNKWRDICKTYDISGREQEMLVISEAGLYKLIMRSNKPIAEKFQEWVCEEVLPSIRKKGQYVLEEYKKQLDEQKKITEEKQKLIEEQQKKAEEDKKTLELDKLHIEALKAKALRHINTNIVHDKYAVYMVTNDDLKKRRVYIVGRAVDLNKRLSSYNKTSPTEVIVSFGCKSREHMSTIEGIIICKLRPYREVSNHDRFILPEKSKISFFTNIMKNCVDFFNNEEIDKEDFKTQNDKNKIQSQKDYQEDNKDYISVMKKRYSVKHKDRIKKYAKIRYIKHKQSILRKNKQYRDSHKDQVKLYKRSYAMQNPSKLREFYRKYYLKHKTKRLRQNKERYEKNKEKYLKQQKLYYEKNKEEILQKQKKYRIEKIDPVTAKEYNKEYREKNKDKIFEQRKGYREKNKEKILEKTLKYAKENPDKVNANQRKCYNAHKDEKIECGCGSIYSKPGKKSHVKTKKHLEWVNQTTCSSSS